MRALFVHRPLYQLLMILFFVTLIPFFVLSLASNQVASHRLQTQRIEQLSFQLNTKSQELEDDLLRIYRSMQLFVLNNTEVLSLADEYPSISSYRLGSLVSSIHKNLIQLSMNSDFIEDIEAYIPAIDRSVGLVTYYEDQVAPEKKEEYQLFIKGNQYSFHVVNNHVNITVLPPSVAKRNPAYLLNVTLSASRLKQFFRQYDEAGQMMLLGDGWALSGGNHDERVESLRSNLSFALEPAGYYTAGKDLYCYQKASSLNAYLIGYTPLETLTRPLEGFTRMSFLALILAIILTFLVRSQLYSVINKPFRKLMNMFSRVEQGELEIQEEPDIHGELGVVYERFQRMLSRIRELIIQTVAQNKALQKAEFKQLQSQIAPHFLYNSFNVLRHSILSEDLETSEQLAKHLGDYFRFITYTDQEDVSLYEEYQHTKAYLEIQKIRFQDNIQVTVEPLPEEYRQIRLPRLVMQPLAENIFKHGVRDMSYASEIRIWAERVHEQLNIVIRDNGAGMEKNDLDRLQKAMEDHSGFPDHRGLVNTHNRLKLHGGPFAGLKVSSERNHFFEVRLCLPLPNDLKQENENDTSADC